MKCFMPIATVLLLIVSSAVASEKAPAKPDKSEKCPVCGMFVAHYPDFMAQVVFKDGSYSFFCGVKDMMKYYFDLPQYNPSKKISDISALVVTDYSTMMPIDGYQAYYVVGSVVFGPMGQEFFPFREESDAQEFLRENQGKEIVLFNRIDPEVLKELIRKY